MIYTTDNGAETFSWPDGGTTPFKGEKNTNWEGGYRVPAMVRWPGQVPARTEINDVFSAEDWATTLVAAAGEPDVKNKLLSGYDAAGKNFKVHLDGYDQRDLLARKGPNKRREFFYWTDDGNLAGLRYDQWKAVFLEQKAHGFDVWSQPMIQLRLPSLFNLRSDPFERAQHEAGDYVKWFVEHAFVLVPAQAVVGQHLMSFQQFPPRQRPGSFSVEQAMEKLRNHPQATEGAIQTWMESLMKLVRQFTTIDRRALLSSLAMLPLLSAALRSTTAKAQAERDPLPSWNDGVTKSSILDFVARVTTQGGPDFVPVDQRIATFDNDGTLWVEQPMYIQLAFALDRVKVMAPMHPEWKTKQPFAAVLDNDLKALAASGEKGLVEIIAVTHAGMTTAEFEKIVTGWLATARDPRFKRPYTELVYQPMLELLAYLRANGFKTFIVSGGGIEFMRPWTERIYGVPPGQVVGSSIKTRYEMKDGAPTLFRLPEVNFIDDKAGKPIGINEHIGRRPIAAFGNSDGDLEMLQWATLGAVAPDSA